MDIKLSSKKASLLQGFNQLKWIIFFGMVWLALGVVYIPVNKIYQQGIVTLFYVPLLVVISLNLKLIAKLIAFNRIFFAFLGLLLLYSILNSVFFSNFKSAKHVFYILLFISSGFFIVLFDFSETLLKRTLFFILISVCFISIASIYNFFYLEGYSILERMWGVLGVHHPILGSYYIGVFLLVSLFFLVDQKKLYMLPFIVILSSYILFSQSRGAYLAIFIAPLLYGFLVVRKSKYFLVSIFVFLSCTAVLGYVFSEQIMLRGDSNRPEIMALSIEVGIKSLWFGHGIGYDFSAHAVNSTEVFRHTHNLLMHIFIELGLFGVMLFSVLWLYCLYYCYRNRELGLARFNILLIIFSSIAFQFDAASFIGQPRLEWTVSWLPVCITAAVIATRYLEYCKEVKITLLLFNDPLI